MTTQAPGTRSLERADEKVVYFVRHGQSEGNVTPVFQPLESPLNETGKVQARKIAERVARLNFDALISSPLRRTEQTAAVIEAATGKKVEYSDLFAERFKPSSLAGKSFGDPEADKVWKQWEISLYTSGLRVDDGENFDDLVRRADTALDYLGYRPENSIVVVTHGYFLRVIFARVLLGDALTGEVFKNFQAHIEMENTGLSVLRYGKRYGGSAWRLWIYNDHTHLG